jgi:hypothetical protein
MRKPQRKLNQENKKISHTKQIFGFLPGRTGQKFLHIDETCRQYSTILIQQREI